MSVPCRDNLVPDCRWTHAAENPAEDNVGVMMSGSSLTSPVDKCNKICILIAHACSCV